MGKRENAVESYLHDEVVAIGGDTFKWKGENGEPDRIVILPDGAGVWFVEVKTTDGTRQPNQKVFHRRMLRTTEQVITVYGHEGVDRFIEMVRKQCKR